MTSFSPILPEMIAPPAPARPQRRAADTQDRFSDFLDEAATASDGQRQPDGAPPADSRNARANDGSDADDSNRTVDQPLNEEMPPEDASSDEAVAQGADAAVGVGTATGLLTIIGANLAATTPQPSDPIVSASGAATPAAGDAIAAVVEAVPTGAITAPSLQAGDLAAIPTLASAAVAGVNEAAAEIAAQEAAGAGTATAAANTAAKDASTGATAEAAVATDVLETAPGLASFAKPTLEPPKSTETQPAKTDTAASTPAKAATIAPAGEAAPVTPTAPVQTPETPPSQTVAAASEQKTDEASQTKAEPAKPDAAKPETARLDPTRTDTARPDATRQPEPIIARPQPVATPQSAATQAPVALPHLAVTVAARARGGERQFDIRLDPAELGRIDVRLSIDEQGTATTRIAVERADTLDLLQRDARALERALSQAGFKTEDGSVQFSLRNDNDDASHRQPGGFNEQGGQSKRYLVVDPELGGDTATPPPAIGAAHYGRGFARLGGVDVRV